MITIQDGVAIDMVNCLIETLFTAFFNLSITKEFNKKNSSIREQALLWVREWMLPLCFVIFLT